MKLKTFTFSEFIRLLKANKRRYIRAFVITFVLAAIYSLSLPKEYTSSTTLAPEYSSGLSMNGGLGALASMTGIDLSKMSSDEDALFPDLYPEIVKSTDFMDHLIGMQVTTADRELTTTLKDYMRNHQKMAWWTKGLIALKKLFPKKKEEMSADGAGGKGPRIYSEEDVALFKGLGKAINLKQDLKTGIITVTATMQDPYIAAVVVDSVSSQLQNYIYTYRTHKAAKDLAFSEELIAKSHAEYEAASRAYANYADQHHSMILESGNTRRDFLENEMNLKYQLYQQYSQQAALAKARLQERTPVYNIIQPPVVPVRKSAPKRMIIVALWEILVFCGMSVWLILKDDEQYEA